MSSLTIKSSLFIIFVFLLCVIAYATNIIKFGGAPPPQSASSASLPYDNAIKLSESYATYNFIAPASAISSEEFYALF